MQAFHPESQFEQVKVDFATPISKVITETFEFAGKHRSRFGNEPMEGSQAAREIAEQVGDEAESRIFDL